jgi:hypothetical protein
MQELLDRQEIVDCIHRYTRGVDRLDEDLILSAFHEDAIDYHGTFVGSPREFVAWLWPNHAKRVATQHFVTNHSIDIEGDTAHVETYFFVPQRNEGDPDITFASGRYVDRFDRRNGEWKIACRVVVMEWTGRCASLPIHPTAGIGRRDDEDVSYHRPLTRRPDPVAAQI